MSPDVLWLNLLFLLWGIHFTLLLKALTCCIVSLHLAVSFAVDDKLFKMVQLWFRKQFLLACMTSFSSRSPPAWQPLWPMINIWSLSYQLVQAFRSDKISICKYGCRPSCSLFFKLRLLEEPFSSFPFPVFLSHILSHSVYNLLYKNAYSLFKNAPPGSFLE